MRYFENCKTFDDLRKTYKKLSVQNHPDNGGNEDIMKAINTQYDSLFNTFKNEHNTQASQDTTGKTREMHETPEQFRNIINTIIHLNGITIELCGMWVWVCGDTREHKEIFKSYGFRWASKKKMWYWRNEADAVKSRGTMSMSAIRQKYGSETINKQPQQKTITA